MHFRFKCCWEVLFIFIQILIEHSVANSGDPDQMPRFAASDLGSYCLPMSHKKTLGLCVLIHFRIKGEVGTVKVV